MQKSRQNEELDSYRSDLSELRLELERLRHEAEQKNRFIETLLKHVPAHIYWLDRNNVYLGCNELQAERLGLHSPQDIIGKRNSELNVGVAHELDIMNNHVMTSGEMTIAEEPSITTEGPMYCLSYKIPVSDGGVVIGLIGISFDITARKQAEELIKAEKENAERANADKTNFILNMSHDIRTPITSILSLAQILNQREIDPQNREIIKMLEQSGNAAIQLMDGIIQSFRNENVKLTPATHFNISDILNQVVSMFSGEIKRKNLSFNLALSDDLPKRVYGYSLAFERIIMNFVSNAIKFTKQGSISISANLIRETDQYQILQFTISDTGIGIPEEKQQTIFEKFNRLNASYEGEYDGSGLGLWIVRKLLDMFDGKVTIDSAVNKGTTFFVELRFEKELGSIEALPQDSESHVQNADKLSSFHHILFVEDQPIPLFAGKTILADTFNCPVDTVGTVKEAISKLSSREYELVLLDIGLPDGNGHEIAEFIRTKCKKNRDTLIVGLSAHYDKKIEPSLEKYFDVIALKPLTYQKCLQLTSRIEKNK